MISIETFLVCLAPLTVLAVLLAVPVLNGLALTVDQVAQTTSRLLLDLVQAWSAFRQAEIDHERQRRELDYQQANGELALQAKQDQLQTARRMAEINVLTTYDRTEIGRAQAQLMIKAQRAAMKSEVSQ